MLSIEHKQRLLFHHKPNSISVIGFTGPMNVGKSTCAGMFSRTQEKICESVEQAPEPTFARFSEPMKRMVVALLRELGKRLTILDLNSQVVKRMTVPGLGYPITIREVMQSLGIEWGRKTISPDLWVSALANKLKSTPDLILVDDCRFENEARWIRSKGLLIHLKPAWHKEPQPKADHESEQGVRAEACDLIFGFPNIIEAKETIEELAKFLNANKLLIERPAEHREPWQQ